MDHIVLLNSKNWSFLYFIFHNFKLAIPSKLSIRSAEKNTRTSFGFEVCTQCFMSDTENMLAKVN